MSDIEKVKANPEAAAKVIEIARVAAVDVQNHNYMGAKNQIDAIIEALAELDKG